MRLKLKFGAIRGVVRGMVIFGWFFEGKTPDHEVELDINVVVASFDVIFNEKLVIGESVDFLGIFVFI